MNLENEEIDLNLMHLPVRTVLITLLGLVFMGYLGGQLLVVLTLYINGKDLNELLTILNNGAANLGDRNLLKVVTLINHLAIFLIPSSFLTWFIYKNRSFEFLKLNQNPKFTLLLLTFVLIPAFAPIVQLSLEINALIPLPDWATSMEAESENLIKAFLEMDNLGELCFTFFLMAIIPAVGEELLFRGVLQQTLARRFKNPHIAVWVTAFIFSFFHFQFEGFLPRMVLGALLGYLLVWTNNLWIPIFAHLVFNGSQVLAAWFMPEEIDFSNADTTEPLPLAAYIFSFIFVTLIVYYLRKIVAHSNKESFSETSTF